MVAFSDLSFPENTIRMRDFINYLIEVSYSQEYFIFIFDSCSRKLVFWRPSSVGFSQTSLELMNFVDWIRRLHSNDFRSAFLQCFSMHLGYGYQSQKYLRMNPN